MHRRDAFASAGAITAVAATVVIAFGANVGLFGLAGNNGGPGGFPLVGKAQANATPPPIVGAQNVDQPVATRAPAPSSTRSLVAESAPTAHAPVVSAPAASAPAPAAPAASAPAPAASAPAPVPGLTAPALAPAPTASPSPGGGGDD